jgi:hypothetical protein
MAFYQAISKPIPSFITQAIYKPNTSRANLALSRTCNWLVIGLKKKAWNWLGYGLEIKSSQGF